MIMKNKKVIIISAQDSLRDFFELEALNFDFAVDCFSKFERIHNDISNYDLAIIDKDTVKQSPLNTAKKELTVSKEDGKCDLTYPISIKVLRKIYSEISLDNECNKTDLKNEDNDSKIVFYKDEKNIVRLNKRKYVLSDTEYKILTLLCKNSQKTVLREDIQELFENGSGNISDVYICKLRKKLEGPLGQKVIVTVREKGYKIITESEWR